jgi:hypothetical protein
MLFWTNSNVLAVIHLFGFREERNLEWVEPTDIDNNGKMMWLSEYLL